MSRVRMWFPENVPPQANVSFDFGISGHFDIEVVDAETGTVKQRASFKNMITDSGLDAIGRGILLEDLFQYVEVGTGTNSPLATDASLQTPVAPRTNYSLGGSATAFITGSAPYWRFSRKRQFTEAQANGNLTEIGFWTESTLGILANRLLFKDQFGTPITITKTSRDVMNIRYEWRIYPMMLDTTGSITINSIPHDFYVRPLNIDNIGTWGVSLDSLDPPNAHGLLGALGYWSSGANTATAYESSVSGSNILLPNSGSSPSTAGVSPNSVTILPYLGGTFYKDEVMVWGPTAANFPTGIGFFTFRALGYAAGAHHQMLLAPKIIKVLGQTLTLTVRYRWGRYTANIDT